MQATKFAALYALFILQIHVIIYYIKVKLVQLKVDFLWT